MIYPNCLPLDLITKKNADAFAAENTFVTNWHEKGRSIINNMENPLSDNYAVPNKRFL